MNDRELAQDLRDDADVMEAEMRWSVADNLRAAAARLDALRWRSVEERLPTLSADIEVVFRDAPASWWRGRFFDAWYVDGRVYATPQITHWRYATPPGAEGGGA